MEKERNDITVRSYSVRNDAPMFSRSPTSRQKLESHCLELL